MQALVLDCHYLCHRAFHTTRDLSYQGKVTGVLYGFFSTLHSLMQRFPLDRVAFCFDSPCLKRKEVFPAYKNKRHTKERTPEELEAYKSFAVQVSELKERHLSAAGFRNVLCCRGMESDDILASFAQSPLYSRVILVTGDSDLWQCVSPTVSVYSPVSQTLCTHSSFLETYGIEPRRWALVKAIAGCSGDEVPGIRGVGEKTALAYVKRLLKPESKAFQSIQCPEGREIVRRNRKLVQLPMEGCPPAPLLLPDEVTLVSWRRVCASLGMRSLAPRVPRGKG